MPSLTPEDQANLLGPVGNKGNELKCATCKRVMSRGYCRECDEFYFTCGCNTPTGHEGHRTY